jgi:hypothetical protein
MLKEKNVIWGFIKILFKKIINNFLLIMIHYY